MANPYGAVFSEVEKRYLLAEILKYHAPSAFLMGALNNLGIQEPNWNDIPLPPGRSLNACRMVFAELKRTPTTSILQGSIAPQTPSPMSAHTSLKRPYASEGSAPAPASYPSGRALLPRVSMHPGGYGQQSPIEQPPTKKKRGRPTKAEAQARAEATVMPGEVGSSQRPQIVVPSPAVQQPPPVLQSPAIEQPVSSEARPLPPVSGMPISSMLTPIGPKTASQSSSSSGKRRRGRSTRSEPEDFMVPQTSAGGQRGYEYESPYARMAGEPVADSPPRTTVMRHREEGEPEPLQPEDTKAPSTPDPAPDTT